MSATALMLEELELLWVLPLEPRPSCHLEDCSCEAIWNLYWENSCPNHPSNPTPYCNWHKEIVESRVPKSLRRGFRCGMCARKNIVNYMGHLLRIERINV